MHRNAFAAGGSLWTAVESLQRGRNPKLDFWEGKGVGKGRGMKGRGRKRREGGRRARCDLGPEEG